MYSRLFIKCIFLAEFHPQVGPSIVTQVPDGYFSCDRFNQVSEYIIPKPELCDRLTAVRDCDGDWVLGHPIRLRHSKFARKAIIFNVCFVFDSKLEPKSFVSIENLVAKVARYTADLEIESSFLTAPSPTIPINAIFTTLMRDINQNSFSILPVNQTNVWHLKLDPIWQDPPQVLDHEVPVPVVDFLSHFGSEVLSEWDLSIRMIIPHLNGTNHVAKIAEITNQDCSIVRSSIQHLLYFNCVTLTDIFQYGNMYRVTPGIRRFFQELKMQEDCLASVRLNPKKPLPSFDIVFCLYCKLQPGITVHQLTVMEKKKFQDSNICLKKWIIFGILNGFVQRVHKYPLSRSDNPLPLALIEKIHSQVTSSGVVDTSVKSSTNGDQPVGEGSDITIAIKRKKSEEYIKSLIIDGGCSYDQLSTQFGLNNDELDLLFSSSFFK
eukprot:TRINITY_DN8073_c0_g1_i10.p1 TRINITY_DN8073_c0_g1~~TRINITY_DN8073_c0_g1_i10.p1  ORF type:complete len:436 (-),score=52.94 TRINITY_DN8073_c0_g1_i10:241-1548(-)